MIDWQALIADIRSTGLTLAQIGKAVDTSTSGISDIARGATREPRWKTGKNLLRLHNRVKRRAAA
jgi:transcriptional regulator